MYHAIAYPIGSKLRPLCGSPGGGLTSADSHVDCPACIPLIDLSARSEDAAAERARIRQLALDEAERHGNEGRGIQNKTFRDFAALLEDR